MSVFYRLVPGYTRYKVGTDGSFWFLRSGKWVRSRMIPEKDKRGYLRTDIRDQGKRKQRRVHQLVLETFVGPAPPGMQALHKDDDPTNNNLSNLYYGTRRQNKEDQRRLGNMNAGVRNGKAKLNQDKVMKIRAMRAQGLVYREIAECFGVSWGTVQAVLEGRTWSHVQG